MNNLNGMFRDISELTRSAGPVADVASASSTSVLRSATRTACEEAIWRADDDRFHEDAIAADCAEGHGVFETDVADAAIVQREQIEHAIASNPTGQAPAFIWQPLVRPRTQSSATTLMLAAFFAFTSATVFGATAIREAMSEQDDRLARWSHSGNSLLMNVAPAAVREPMERVGRFQSRYFAEGADRSPAERPNEITRPSENGIPTSSTNSSDTVNVAPHSVEDLIASIEQVDVRPSHQRLANVLSNTTVGESPAWVGKTSPLQARLHDQRTDDDRRSSREPYGTRFPVANTEIMASSSAPALMPTERAIARRPIPAQRVPAEADGQAAEAPHAPAQPSGSNARERKMATASRAKGGALSAPAIRGRYGLGGPKGTHRTMPVENAGTVWLVGLPAPSTRPEWARKAFESRD